MTGTEASRAIGSSNSAQQSSILRKTDGENRMSSYRELLNQLHNLTAEVEAARLAEFQRVVEEVRATVTAYKITAQDIFPPSAEDSSDSGSAISRGRSVTKYRNPHTGATWSGRGRKPHWLRNVTDLGAFLVK
ncbi:H-NS family nucleoid-associated regulatory protein [Burkholderia anthina]|uniref:H-NS histone family protein n=1 Tax=Burkholderia anthina TaxID=179879 RepID=UPI0037C022A3